MAVIRLLTSIALCSIISTASARLVHDHKGHQHHQHAAVEVGKRHPPIMGPPPEVTPSPTGSAGVLTYITPSPGASRIAVTKESQIVTSFVPQFTLCELPPIEFFPISSQPISVKPTGAPYHNYSISIPPGNGTCTTIYSPTKTTVCATTLTGLVDKYTVTRCHQDLTFSTKYGYVLETPVPTHQNTRVMRNGTASTGLMPRAAYSNATAVIMPAPAIETFTTLYLAPWQELTAGTAPTNVDLKVCRTFAQNDSTECVREYQVWSTSLVTETATSVTSINISTTIHGKSKLIVETFVANVTELLTTFSLSTTMDMKYRTHWTSTYSATRHMLTSTGPTVYETLTVEEASQTS